MVRACLGLDFGTGSVRCVLVDAAQGGVLGSGEAGYAHGRDGVVTEFGQPDLARQWPDDYLVAMRAAVSEALRAGASVGLNGDDVVSIGVDGTGSTPIPVDVEARPLCSQAQWQGEPAAMAWLWKDHTAHAEAEEITALARAERPQWLARCGGAYSAEWLWAKALRCARHAPAVFARAAAFVELSDWIPAVLTGVRAPEQVVRGVCAAGHKGLYAQDLGGWPDAQFLGALHPGLAALRERLPAVALPSNRGAGGLAPGQAKLLGLCSGIPVAVGALDAHLGAVGAGIAEGDLVKVLGTSSCDLAIARLAEPPPVLGLSGVVADSIVPGFVGFEAGQPATGDVLHWCAQSLGGGDHAALTRDAAAVGVGASGLLALDWHNGNRSILANAELSGLLLGLNLHSTAAEIYRAMIEATAFGARVIVDRLVRHGAPVRRVIACGGVASKNDLVLQVYADVLGRRIEVAPGETCALGAAIMGAVAAGVFPDVPAAQAALCPSRTRAFEPEPGAWRAYDTLFALYRRVHDAFGGVDHACDLGSVMQQLRALRRSARGG